MGVEMNVPTALCVPLCCECGLALVLCEVLHDCSCMLVEGGWGPPSGLRDTYYVAIL